MSKIVRCAEGHYYDADKFSTCPHCDIKSGKFPGNDAKEPGEEDLDDAVTVAKHFFVKKDRIRKKPEVSGEIVKPPKKDLKDEITPEMWEVGGGGGAPHNKMGWVGGGVVLCGGGGGQGASR
ncbi:MAG: hypothetical protein LUF92_16380, partial [Clostridiales bacterium]|nr:hypothetical protein [Clostridiales bacterium]